MKTRLFKSIIIIALVMVSCLPAVFAGTVNFALTNFDLTLSTNGLRIYKAQDSPLVDGVYLVLGSPVRVPTTNGLASKTLLAGNYELRVEGYTLPRPVYFAVPSGAGTNNLTDLRISGVNFFNYNPYAGTASSLSADLTNWIVSVTGTNGGTSGALTNNETRDVVLQGSLTANNLAKLMHGNNSIATGIGAHAEGVNTIASGIYSHTEGNSTYAEAAASYSHADGVNAAVTQPYSFIWNGDNTSPTTNSATKSFMVNAPGGIRLLGGPIYGDAGGLTNVPGSGGGGFSGNPNQFTTSGGQTNIRSGAIVTNFISDNLYVTNSANGTNVAIVSRSGSVINGVGVTNSAITLNSIVNTQGLTQVRFDTNALSFGNAARSNANIHIKDGALWMPSAGWGAAGNFSGNTYGGAIAWGSVPGVGNSTPPADNSGGSPWAKLSAFWYWGGQEFFPSGNPWAILTAPNVRIEEGSAGVIPYNGTAEIGNEDHFGSVEINYTPTWNQLGTDEPNVMGFGHPLNLRAKFVSGGSPGWSVPSIQSRATTTGPGYGPGGDPTTMGEIDFLTYRRIPNGTTATNAWTTFPGLVVGTMRTNGWNLRGTFVQQQSSLEPMSPTVTNIFLDFNTTYAQTITPVLASTNIVWSTNWFGGSSNYQSAVFRIKTGMLQRDFIWPSNWTVISDYGTNVIPTRVAASNIVHLKMESWGHGETNIVVRYGIGTDKSVFYDPDAATFFTRSGITDGTQKAAVDYLAKALKAANCWTNIAAIYPFVGASSNANAINLKSTSFNITFTSSGVTHDANGITGNGTTGSGDTGIDPRTVLGALGRSNAHCYVYCRTQTRTGFQRDFATTTTTGGTLRFGVFNDGTSFAVDGPNNSDTSSFDNLAGDFRGMLGWSRPGVDPNSWITVTRSAVTARSTASTGIPTGKNLLVLARSFEGFSNDSFSSANLALASVGWGYTSNELFVVRAIVDNYQTILGRKTP